MKGNKGEIGKQESGEHMVNVCPQRLARTEGLSSCLSMWAHILPRHLRPCACFVANKHIDWDTHDGPLFRFCLVPDFFSALLSK